jgi:rhodanese-related sulfurtransferase
MNRESVFMKTAYILLISLFMAFLPGCCGISTCNKKTGLVVINVLDKDLYNDCRIKGSINIPFEMIENSADQIDKNADVVIYCSNYQCASSEYAARKLKEKGFTKVSVYEGGMAEWYQQGLPVEGPQTQPYLKRGCSPTPLEAASEIPIISVDELAQKMGIAKEKKGAA